MFRFSYIVSQIFMHNTATGDPLCPQKYNKWRMPKIHKRIGKTNRYYKIINKLHQIY